MVHASITQESVKKFVSETGGNLLIECMNNSYDSKVS